MAGKADVRYLPELVTPDEIVDFIEDLGFGASLMESNTNNGNVELNVSEIKNKLQKLMSKKKLLACLKKG